MVFLCMILAQTIPEGAWVVNTDTFEEIPSWVYKAVVTPLEQVYFLDLRESRIYHLDDSGKFKRAFGRKGKGPGEFERATYLGLTPSGNVLVGEPQRKSLWAFNANGEYVGLHAEDVSEYALPLGDEAIVFRREKDPVAFPNHGCEMVHLSLKDSKETVLKHIPDPLHQDILLKISGRSRAGFNVRWLRKGLATSNLNQSLLFLGSNDKLAIEVFRAETLAKVSEIADESIPNLPLEEDEVLGDKSNIRMGGKVFYLKDFEHSKTMPAFADMFCDTQNRLWVELTPSYESYKKQIHSFRVYAIEGQCVGTFEIRGATIFHANESFIWLITNNEDDDQLIVKTPYTLDPVP